MAGMTSMIKVTRMKRKGVWTSLSTVLPGSVRESEMILWLLSMVSSAVAFVPCVKMIGCVWHALVYPAFMTYGTDLPLCNCAAL